VTMEDLQERISQLQSQAQNSAQAEPVPDNDQVASEKKKI